MLTKPLISSRSLFAILSTPLLVFGLAGCASQEAPTDDAPVQQGDTAASPVAVPEDDAGEDLQDDEVEEQPAAVQEETCDWDSPRLTGSAEAPVGQNGELTEVLVGQWQHTHTDEGSGFEAVENDHRFVFPEPERMLYCQHVPGVTDYAENATDVVLNDTAIEWAGGDYSYTVLEWDENTMLWDNRLFGILGVDDVLDQGVLKA